MPTTYTEQASFAGEFVKSIVGGVSREKVTLISGQNLKAGTVLGKITASGKYTILAPAAGDGSQTATAVLLDDTDASAGDTPTTVVERIAEVVDVSLTWPVGITGPQKAAAVANLLGKNIAVR